MSDNTNTNPFDKEGGHPVISFAARDEMGNMVSKPKGTRIGGRVVEAPKLVQQRNFNTKQPDWWDAEKTQPKMAVVTALDVNGVTMSLWAKKPSDLFAAINKVMNETGGGPIVIGDTLFVELVGATMGDDPNKAPAKNYIAHLTRGAGAFAGETTAVAVTVPATGPVTAAAVPAPPAAVPAPPAAVPAPPAPVAVWAGQAERDAFLAGGWSAEQIAAHHPHLVPPVASAVPAPPVAATAVDPRQASIDAMPEADRELLGLKASWEL